MYQTIYNLLNDTTNTFINIIKVALGYCVKGIGQFSNPAMASVNQITSGLTAIAGTILAIMFFVNLIKAMGKSAEARTPVHIVKEFIRLACIEILVMNISQVLTGIRTIGVGLCSAPFSGVTGGSAFVTWFSNGFTLMPQSVRTAFQNSPDMSFMEFFTSGTWQGFLHLIIALIVSLVIIGSAIIVFVEIVTRFFKLYVLTAISPLPIASFGGDENTRQIGNRFIRSYIVVVSQCFVYQIILTVYKQWVSTASMPSWIKVQTITSEAASSKWVLPWLAWVALLTIVLIVAVKGVSALLKEFVG